MTGVKFVPLRLIMSAGNKDLDKTDATFWVREDAIQYVYYNNGLTLMVGMANGKEFAVEGDWNGEKIEWP